MIGLCGSAATAMPYAVAVRSLFDRERGLAFGLVNFGSGIGSATAPYCASALLHSFGWRGGFLAVGLAGIAPALGVLLLVREPERARQVEVSGSARSPWLAVAGRMAALWVTWAWGGGIGAFIAGASYRALGSYTAALGCFAVLLCLCTIIVCQLGPYEYPVEGKERWEPKPRAPEAM